MTVCAFYAPLKPPDHPVPSGDRTIARAVISALKHAGNDVRLASEFQSRDGQGDVSKQNTLFAEAKTEIDRAVQRGKSERWQAWVTYHNYYKAPDLIGPAVSRQLGVPYILIEATRARKRLNGPWAKFAKAAESACDAANTVFYLTQRDGVSLREYAPAGQRHIHLRPFLDVTHLPEPSAGGATMLCVGMFRKGDKLDSYRIVAEALDHLETENWKLLIAGSGPEEQTVRALMAPYSSHIGWLGPHHPRDMHKVYAQAGVLFWPGVNEAFGMAYLEAQAAGLVAVAQDRPGVTDVLAPGLERPLPQDGAIALARQLDELLQNAEARKTAAALAREYIEATHLLGAASNILNTELKVLTA